MEFFASKKQKARPQRWALASTFRFPFCHSWFLHCIISCITFAQSGLISWKCKIKIKPRVSRWHSARLSSPNTCALLGKWELVFPIAEWPPALEGYVYSFIHEVGVKRKPRPSNRTLSKRQPGVSLKEIELLPTYQLLFTHQNPCTFYYAFCLLMDELESTNFF